MAKLKPAGKGRSKRRTDTKGIVSCLFLLVTGFTLVFLLFYVLLQSGATK